MNIFILFVVDLFALFSVYLVLNLALNFQLGYGGVPNFGLVLSFTGGAMVMGWLPIRILGWLFKIPESLMSNVAGNSSIIASIINTNLQTNPLLGLGILIITLILGMAFGAFLGFISSLPAIRLKSDYLAISLLALGVILYYIGLNYFPLVGGTLGVVVPDLYTYFGINRYIIVTVIFFIIIVLLIYILTLIVNSPYGRVLRAMRDNEIAASSMGKNVIKIRMQSMVIGSMIAALAGGMYASYNAYFGIAGYDMSSWTFIPWLMVLFGGLANNYGVILGTFIYVTLEKLIAYFQYNLTFLPFNVIWLQYILLGFLVLIILIYRPKGLLPEKPSQTLSKNKVKELKS
ncbi:MAG: branched-chain amino acid ABC transporter permease [Candidatus Nanopusillus acidilobi]|jgi:branched-chain amino acid transport system permease protein